MTDFPFPAYDSLCNRIWKTIGEKVGYGIDCDLLTHRVIDVVIECTPKEGDFWLNEDDGILYVNKGWEVATAEALE